MSEDGTDKDNVAIAFALVIGAGASTGLGAAVVFFPTFVKYASRRTLAGALGLSAGVMSYVSFVEIYQKSKLSFEDAGHDPDQANIYATICFFGGVILMVTLNFIVSALLGGHHHYHGHEDANNHTDPVSNDESVGQQGAPSVPIDGTPRIPCCSDDPVGQLQAVRNMAEEIENFEHREHHHWEGQHQETSENKDTENEQTGGIPRSERSESDAGQESEENHKLMRMSINTALAIGLHNFPEGLATFVAAVDDPAVGAVLAMAIAIHNIPEGLCVAMPVYYATGNRWKAFGWALLSGVAEPIAALLGWAILASSFSNTMYAVLFGVVAGMMVIISVRELLPTAHRYDPTDTVVTYSFMGGMAIMAVSLILFLL